jgi:uncharacterized membrane-anchored protein
MESKETKFISKEKTKLDEESQMELDKKYAGRFWERLRDKGDSKESIKTYREQLKRVIKNNSEIGQIKIPVGKEGITEEDRERLSAYRMLGREISIIVGQYKFDRERGVAIAELVKDADAEYAERYWQYMRDTYKFKNQEAYEKFVQSTKEQMKYQLEKSVDSESGEGTFNLMVDSSGITEHDKQRISAFRVIAREMGYGIEKFSFNENSGTATAPIKRLRS